MLRRSWIGVLPLVFLVAGGCATELSTSWRDPTAGTLSFKKVAVLVLNSSPGDRRAQEDELVRQIKKTTAVPSYTFVPDSDLGDRERVKRLIGESGADGAVVLRIIEARQETTYVPGASSYWHDNVGYAPFHYNPAHYMTSTSIRAEVSLYSVPDGKLLWAGASTTWEPANAADLAKQVSGAAAKELRKQGLLP
jgi:hypothetical protein